MSSVVHLVQFDIRLPARRKSFNGKLLLVALFPDDRVLVAFANHLYHAHDILTVDDWDNHGRRHIETYPMDARSKRRFLKLVGTPNRSATDAVVLPMSLGRVAALG
jgi:hypothetical protein